jgi:toxin ParE1/3/4
VLGVRIAGPARRDAAAILARSRKEFGEAAADRYAALIAQALRDIGDDPECPGSIERHNIAAKGTRTSHLWFSRSRVSVPSVATPRHFLLYRCLDDGVIEVGRILHDSRDLQRHLPEGYRHH